MSKASLFPYPDTPQPLMPFSVDFLWSVFTRLRACTTSLFISSVCSAAGPVQYHLVPRPASFQSPCSLGDLKWKCDFITLLLNTFQQLFITPLTKSHFLNTIYSLPQREPSSLSQTVLCHSLPWSLHSCKTQLTWVHWRYHVLSLPAPSSAFSVLGAPSHGYASTGAPVPAPFSSLPRLQSWHRFPWKGFLSPGLTFLCYICLCFSNEATLQTVIITGFILSLPRQFCESGSLSDSPLSEPPPLALCVAHWEGMGDFLQDSLLHRAMPTPQGLPCSALCKIAVISFKNSLLFQCCTFMFSPPVFSVEFKSDSDYFTKCLFNKTKANNEGISRLEHQPGNTRKSSGCFLKVHKYLLLSKISSG